MGLFRVTRTAHVVCPPNQTKGKKKKSELISSLQKIFRALLDTAAESVSRSARKTRSGGAAPRQDQTVRWCLVCWESDNPPGAKWKRQLSLFSFFFSLTFIAANPAAAIMAYFHAHNASSSCSSSVSPHPTDSQ